MKMLINFSNHKFEKWSEAQRAEAIRLFQNIHDIAFPVVDAEIDFAAVKELAKDELEHIKLENKGRHFSVLLAGEQSFIIAFYELCKLENIPLYTATSDRISQDIGEGKKVVTYQFKSFRKII